MGITTIMATTKFMEIQKSKKYLQYYKNFNRIDDTCFARDRQDFTEYFRYFGTAMIEDNRRKFEGIVNFKDHKEGKEIDKYLDTISDFAAGHFSALFQTSLVKRKEFISKALGCCERIMIDLGYVSENRKTITELSIGSKNYIYTAGCQNPKMLESRGGSLAQLFIDLCDINSNNSNIEVICGGATPPTRKRVNFTDESKELANSFYSKLLEYKSKRYVSKIYKEPRCESKSRDTKENIANLMELINGDKSEEPVNLYITSSTFHTIRLAKEVEFYLSENSHNININNLILVGAESPSTESDITMLPKYIKQTLFEIYRYFLPNEEFLRQMLAVHLNES